MRVQQLENLFCEECGREETVEVEYDVERLLGGGEDRTPIRAKCRLGHRVEL